MLRDQPFMRDDTFLGVCQSLGEDFRIPPNLLRLAMAPMLVWNPVMTLVGYFVLGVMIALLRWIVPNPVQRAAAAVAPTAAEPEVDVQHYASAELAKAA